MDWREIAKKASDAVVGIYVFFGDECLSRGSGFLFNDEGLVFTAGHVIDSGKPLTSAELSDAAFKIWVKIKGRPPLEYQRGMPALMIEGGFFKDKLLIDLAGLNPKERLSAPTPFLTTKIRAPEIGESVLMAGFSDEMYPPFVFPHRLNPALEGFPALLAAQKMGFDVDLGMLIVKSGIVGSSFGYSFEGSAGTVKGFTFFLDNGMHSGASGGPIIDAQGEAFGVITERAITRLGHDPQPNIFVPSGATHALTLEPLLAIRSPAK